MSRKTSGHVCLSTQRVLHRPACCENSQAGMLSVPTRTGSVALGSYLKIDMPRLLDLSNFALLTVCMLL